jgi:hypothetical protein
MAGDSQEILALLGLWDSGLELMPSEVDELLQELETWQKLS